MAVMDSRIEVGRLEHVIRDDLNMRVPRVLCVTRPLKLVIQRALQDPLAEALLAGDILDGSTVPVTAGAEGLIIGDRVGSTRQEPPQDAVVH